MYINIATKNPIDLACKNIPKESLTVLSFNQTTYMASLYFQSCISVYSSFISSMA